MLRLNLRELLQYSIVCQRRTAAYKQFVILGKDRVFKGPYTREKIDRIFYLSDTLRKWKTPYVVHPYPDLYSSEEGIFISYPNLAEGLPVEFEPHIESFTGLEYRVLVRSGLVKLGDIILDQPNWLLQHLPWLTLALCQLYILEVGDVGLFNILVHTERKTVYIVDYDEQKGSDRNDEFFYMTKRPAKEKAELWLQHTLQYYPFIALELEKIIDTHPNLESRVNLAIQMLNCFTGRIELPGKMKYQGIFNSTTFSGYTTDIMKSALQKYIRRGSLSKALISGFELYRLGELPQARAIQTNLYNRLAVISCEDIGPANFPLCIAVIREVLADNRKTTTLAALIQLLAESEKTRLMSHLYHVYFKPQGMALAQEKGISVNEQFSEDDLRFIQVLPGEEFEPGQIKPNLFLPGDPEEIKGFVEIFYYRLFKQSFQAMVWLRYFFIAIGMYDFSTGRLKKPTVQVARRRRRTNPATIIWDVLRCFLPAEAVDSLEKIYFKHTEKRPFLMTAIVAAIYRTEYKSFDLTDSVKRWENFPLLDSLLSGRYADLGFPDGFKIDPFVIDMHTRAGKQAGMSRKEFVSEGAEVKPKSERYQVRLFEDIYNQV